MNELIEALKKLNIEVPEYGSLQIIFRNSKAFDIIKEERHRLN